MNDTRHQEFRDKIELATRVLGERVEANAVELHDAQKRFTEESAAIRGELANIVTATRLLLRDRAAARS